MSEEEKQQRARTEDFWRLVRAAEPESRVSDASKRKRTEVIIAGKRWERVYCWNCGADGGVVTAEWSPHVMYICGPERNNCVEKYGALPGMTEVPEDLVRGRG